jgi:hypothetical protein
LQSIICMKCLDNFTVDQVYKRAQSIKKKLIIRVL